MAKSAKKKVAVRKVAKKMASGKANAKSSFERKVAATYRGAKVLGLTTDGVKILQGKGRSPNFTAKEIDAAIASVRAARSAQ